MRTRTILCLVLLVLLISGLLIPPLFRPAAAQQKNDEDQAQPRMSESAAQQIQSLMNEKRSRTAEQKKLDSQLLFTMKQRRGEAIPSDLQRMQVDVKAGTDGKVLVDIKATVTAELIQRIAQVGGEVIHSSARYNAIRARVPLESLGELARSKDVKFIRPAIEAVTSKAGASETGPRGATASPAKLNPTRQPGTGAGFAERAARVRAQVAQALPAVVKRADSLEGPVTAVGALTSLGDSAHRAQEARNFFGATGAGVNIGVLSDSVRFLEQSQASGDLPPDVVVLPGQSGLDIPGFTPFGEGTAMLEIIHDLAPGAKLFFATAFRSPESFAENIRALRAAGCDIIVDDILYLNESPFQDDIVAQAVNDVTEDGALYFSAAFNEGNLNDGTSGTWEGDYVPSQNTPPILGQDFTDVHDFGDGNASNRIERGTGNPTLIHWSDPVGASSNDYDLFVLDANLTQVVRFATNPQDGDDDPFEIVGSTITGQRIVIARFGNAQIRALHLKNFRGELGIGTDGSTYGHNSAAAGFGVAAVFAGVAGGGSFTGGPTNPVELFSSDGLRRIFYNEDGTPITPDNVLFGTNGGTLRQKPDIAAADGVVTTVPGFNPFFGTSAAAPHAAAIAGLVKSANPALTPAEIRTALTSTALDIEAPGVDRDSGVGIAMAFQALEFIGAQPVPTLELGTLTATAVGADFDSFIEPGESGSLAVQLRNIGGALATNVSATLTTSTPGVTITQGASAYPDIAPAGSAVNSTPFTFTVAADAPCGLAINFTLTATYNGPGSPRVFNFTVQTGQPSSSSTTISYTGPAVPIPDGIATGVNIPIEVSGLSNIRDLNFRIDGSACTTQPGATTVGIDHTWVSDLVVTLTSPQGTTVTLMNRPGGAGNSGDNFCNTLLDDEGTGPSIQNILPTGPPPLGPPYTGTFRPANPLAAFDGQNPNGTWTLNVSDRVFTDSGNVRAFSLVFAGFQCEDATLPTGTGLRGEYYSNVDFTDLVLTRVDPTIDFAFGAGSPDPSIDPDTFSVRWSGQVQPEFSEEYTFYTVSDDGVRLTVNGQVIIDNFTNHPPTEDSGTLTLTAGQRYDIQLEYYETALDATAQLLWSSPSQPKQIIPQNRLYPQTVAPPPGPGQLTTLNFGELPFQPVNGLSFMGVTFGFRVGGAPSTDANYNTGGPGNITHLQGAVMEGNAAGVLTLDFAVPTSTLRFGVARSTNQNLTPGCTVELFDPALQSRGITPVNTSPLISFSEGLSNYQGEPVRRAIITFNNPAAAPRFALDNLTYVGPATASQQPETSVRATPGSAPKAVGAAGKPSLWSIGERK